MTNKEYIEKNNISFSDAMKMYDNEKYPCIDYWLSQEHQEHRFKVGDYVKTKTPLGIGIVIDVKDYVYVKIIDRRGYFMSWGYQDDGRKYHIDDHDVYIIFDEDNCEKIF